MLFVVLLTRPRHQGEALREPRVRQHLRISIILLLRRNYSGTLTPTNRKSFCIFINSLPIYKSFQ